MTLEYVQPAPAPLVQCAVVTPPFEAKLAPQSVAPSLAVPVHVASFSASPSTQTYSLRKWLPEVPAGDDIKNPLYSVLHPLGHMTLPGCITEATLRRLFRSGGYFATINASNVTTVIRTIVDFQACGRWLGRAGLGEERSGQMVAFFHRELDQPALGWPIALSRSDALAYVDRPDHGTTGSYASWPPLAFEALAELDGNFTSAMPFFRRAAPSARQGPFGQAQGVSLSQTQNSEPAFKTEPGATRYVAIAGACWAEATIRTIFGWRPGFGGEAEPLWRASEPRGIAATLSGLRLPNGTVGTIVSGPSGVSMILR